MKEGGDAAQDRDSNGKHQDPAAPLRDICLSNSPTASTSTASESAPAVTTQTQTPPAPPQHRPSATAPQQPLRYRNATLATAAAKGDLANVVLLWGMAAAAGIDPMLPDAEGNTALHHAALAEGPDVAAFILQQTGGVVGPGLPLVHLRNADGETPLLRAAAAGHLATIRLLVEQGR